MSFFEKAEDGLMAAAEVIDSNKYLNSIKGAFTDFVPFIVVGSFGSLLNSLVASQTTGLAKWIPALASLKPAFDVLNFATISCMTIPIIFLIALHLANAYKMPAFTLSLIHIFISCGKNKNNVYQKISLSDVVERKGSHDIRQAYIVRIKYVLRKG